MRRLSIFAAAIALGMLALGAAVLLPRSVRAEDGDNGILADPLADPVTVVAPVDGTNLTLLTTPEFIVEWTRFEDALWYQVRLSPPADESGWVNYVEFRYRPDQDSDWQLRNPTLNVATGLLDFHTPYVITVQPFGPSELLLAEYGPDDVKPSGLGMEYYTPLAPASDPVTITVQPVP